MNVTKHELWIAVVNENDYHLDEKQAKVLSEAIASGSRGVVQFDGFIISIPYLQEFYLDKKWEEVTYTLEELKEEESKRLGTTATYKVKELTEEEKKLLEEQEQQMKHRMIERSKLVARGFDYDEIRRIENHKTMTPAEEKKRRDFLKKQAKKLMEDAK